MNQLSDVTLLAASPWWSSNPGTNLVIRGGSRLVGTYPISSAKNAVLPLIVSALLTKSRPAAQASRRAGVRTHQAGQGLPTVPSPRFYKGQRRVGHGLHRP